LKKAINFEKFTNISAQETSEFIPKGYKIGKTKFIFITGGVMSGVGKGVFSGSISSILKYSGFSISPVKFEGYLNVDSGTINPERHGEVFVLDDETECDLDLGSYERFINMNLYSENFNTAGKIFNSLLERERLGQFLGRDLQIIPHLTGQIKYLLRSVVVKQSPDILIVEIGGTVGDLENAYYLEAIRELALEEGTSNSLFCHVTPVIKTTGGEQKSKPTQHSVRRLRDLGIQPDIIVLRSSEKVESSIKEKIALFCNIPRDNVVLCIDQKSIYAVPNALISEGILKIIKRKFKFRIEYEKDYIPFSNYIKNEDYKYDESITIAICGKYSHENDSYLSIVKALEHCQYTLDVKVDIEWIIAEDFENPSEEILTNLRKCDGLIVPGGFGKRGIEGKIRSIQEARSQKIPFLGICLGLQLAIIEIARNLIGLTDANSSEFDTSSTNKVVSLLEEQKGLLSVGGNMRLGGADVHLKLGSKAFILYGESIIRERFRHRYEFDKSYEKEFNKVGLNITGTTPDGEIAQVMELSDHPFFIGTQFHPEFTSRPEKPNPLFYGLCKTALHQKYERNILYR
jgi:CTP synthase